MNYLSNQVVCGVCKKEMLEPNFIYHKYSVHHGLARLEGQSQVGYAICSPANTSLTISILRSLLNKKKHMS